jgi:hypothetical protein
MAETLLLYQHLVSAPDGTFYEARACGGPLRGGTWEGWIEFVPVAGGEPIRSRRETLQPNRVDTAYWATGVSPVYLEGALRRALTKPVEPHVPPPKSPPFSSPPPAPPVPVLPAVASIIDPFSIFDKGEPFLRKQLGAMSAWHLVNIVMAYGLSDHSAALLNSLPAAALIDVIVAGVRKERQAGARRP